jgi:hypothetical protein
LLQRAIRHNALIRRNATKELLAQTVTKFIPVSHPSYQPMLNALENLPDLEVDEATDKMSLDGEDEDKPCDTAIPEVEVCHATFILLCLPSCMPDTN